MSLSTRARKMLQPKEFEMFSGLWTGTAIDPVWFSKEVDCDFYDLKGVVEELLGKLWDCEYHLHTNAAASCFYTKPGATAQILVNNEPMGLVGELHPKVLANYDLKQTAFIFELDLDRIIQLLSDKKARPSHSEDIRQHQGILPLLLIRTLRHTRSFKPLKGLTKNWWKPYISLMFLKETRFLKKEKVYH